MGHHWTSPPAGALAHTLLASLSNRHKAFGSRHEPSFQCSTDMASFGKFEGSLTPLRPGAVTLRWLARSAGLTTADAIYTHGSPYRNLFGHFRLQCHLLPHDSASSKVAWWPGRKVRFLMKEYPTTSCLCCFWIHCQHAPAYDGSAEPLRQLAISLISGTRIPG